MKIAFPRPGNAGPNAGPGDGIVRPGVAAAVSLAILPLLPACTAPDHPSPPTIPARQRGHRDRGVIPPGLGRFGALAGPPGTAPRPRPERRRPGTPLPRRRRDGAALRRHDRRRKQGLPGNPLVLARRAPHRRSGRPRRGPRRIRQPPADRTGRRHGPSRSTSTRPSRSSLPVRGSSGCCACGHFSHAVHFLGGGTLVVPTLLTWSETYGQIRDPEALLLYDLQGTSGDSIGPDPRAPRSTSPKPSAAGLSSRSARCSTRTAATSSLAAPTSCRSRSCPPSATPSGFFGSPATRWTSPKPRSRPKGRPASTSPCPWA